VYVEHISLSNFRNYSTAELSPAPEGITLLHGDNGAGKTNLLEAIAYLGTLKSFRGSPASSLVANGAQQAVLRATTSREGRSMLVEAELNLTGKDKIRINRQAVRRNEELIGTVLTTVFSPDDIEVVKGGPQLRRDYLDDLLSSLHPRHVAARSDMERLLKQRNALLRSANGSLRQGMSATLDVWDTKFASVAETVAEARQLVVRSLLPEVATAYRQLSSRATQAGDGQVALQYERSWEGGLLEALVGARADDVRRGSTSVGPQRDDLNMVLEGLAARTQASQGEQRSLALALRLGGHALVAERQGTSPVLLLDDIFSELDRRRSSALAGCLPAGQALLTTASAVPEDLPVAQVLEVTSGSIHPG
jgi:DNA replication and repair protein RecF